MIIIMLGAPGTGKGTVAGILAKEFEIPQVSTGDIFRKNVEEKTELGKKVETYMNSGSLVPDELTVQLVEDRLKADDAKNGVILDGFPRTVVQAEALDKLLENSGQKVYMTINLETPEEELIERVVNRRVCSNSECKAIYNLELHPPKQEGICDKCGSALITRKDDNRETIQNRLQTYFNQTSPLVEYYKNKDILYSAMVSKSINKMGKDVAEDIVEYIKGE